MREAYTRGLSLAAAPTFALMALVTSMLEDNAAMLCGAPASPFNGMMLMYALMSVFHLAPWLGRARPQWRR